MPSQFHQEQPRKWKKAEAGEKDDNDDGDQNLEGANLNFFIL